MRIIAQTIIKQKILYKALVFDLDDTLWLGTLAEDGFEGIKNNMTSDKGAPYIAFMNFIKTLVKELGIYVAICSRNDMEIVSSAIDKIDETIFPLKKQIDYIVANFNDKSEYDYPQFALPLYNLCSNVGLYETAAITNRSNILSPKYLRLNL